MLLFVDESGTDRREAPYEVLAGVAVRERDLWNLIQAIRAAERNHFGTTLSALGVEFKGKKLLKRKTFRFAAQADPLPPDCRRALAYELLQIVPEPFFVHSDLTTAVQIADIVAYSLNWGLRLHRMDRPTRPEMEPLGQRVFDLRYVGHRRSEENGEMWPVYGIIYIDDLRPRGEREEE